MQGNTPDQTSQTNENQGAGQSSGSSTLNPLPQRNFSNPLSTTPGVQVSVMHAEHPNLAFQNLPQPIGPQPYHLSLNQVLPGYHLEAVEAAGKLIFHTTGDTGGIKSPQFQQGVVDQMVSDCRGKDEASRPAFFYHLGDVVYYFGQGREYYSQFYEPYQLYPAPIFAIPGNHDGEVPDEQSHSLSSFVTNFCAQTPELTRDAGDTHRHAMTQPNVYWTLEAPFVTLIGLYTNVPEGGSQYMLQQLEQAIASSRRVPDAVLSGHVHNYQRFIRSINGRDVPFIVAGAGGFWKLSSMQNDAQGNPLPTPYQFTDLGVTLECYCDNRYGYLLMEVAPDTLKGQYMAISSLPGVQARCIDMFTLDLKAHKLS